MKKKSYAKINLILDVIEKREDGYHNIDGIMQLVDLYDVVDVEIADDFEIICNNKNVPTDERNLVFKAFYLMKEKYKFKENFKITIEKNIPVCAGLAGGSSNCATVINAIDELLDLNLILEEKTEIAKKIGADVTYLLVGKTARTRGIGEKLDILENLPKTRVLIVNNGVEIPTPYVYSNIIPSGKNSRVDDLIKIYNNKDYEKFFKNIYNVMETVSINYCYEIQEIKDKMIEFGCFKSLMSGSGPTVFGIFYDDLSFEKAYKYFSYKYKNTFKTYTIVGGENG